MSGWDESPGGADRALCAGQGSGRPRSPLRGPSCSSHPGGSLGPPLSPPHRGAARLPWGHGGLSRGSLCLPVTSLHRFAPLLPSPRPSWWPCPPAAPVLPAGAWKAGLAGLRPCVQGAAVSLAPFGPGAHVSDGDTWAGLPRRRAPTIDISILKGECTRRASLCPWPYRDTYAGGGDRGPKGAMDGACSLPPGHPRWAEGVLGKGLWTGGLRLPSALPLGRKGPGSPLGVRGSRALGEASPWELDCTAALANPSALLQRPVQTLPLAAA